MNRVSVGLIPTWIALRCVSLRCVALDMTMLLLVRTYVFMRVCMYVCAYFFYVYGWMMMNRDDGWICRSLSLFFSFSVILGGFMYSVMFNGMG